MTSKTILLAALLVAPLGARPQPEAGGAPPAPASPDLGVPAPAAPAPGAAAPVAVADVAAPAAPKRKHGIFPLWGDKVRAKGFDLPEPFGFMTNYYYQKSDINISKLKLGVNGGPMYDAGFIQIPSAQTKGSALAVRPNVMIFPFLSVYGVFSSGATETTVHITEPVTFDTVSKSGAQVVAIGATFQLGYKGFFGVADFNASVADIERLADAVGANMLSFRVGYNHRLDDQGQGIALWVGTAGQVLGVDTKGSVRLGDVIPPPDQSLHDRVQARCDALPLGPQKVLCQQLADKLQPGLYDPNTTVEYSLEKRPEGIWNMILGAQYALDRHWHFRVETTFLNHRTSALAAVEYRFDIL